MTGQIITSFKTFNNNAYFKRSTIVPHDFSTLNRNLLGNLLKLATVQQLNVDNVSLVGAVKTPQMRNQVAESLTILSITFISHLTFKKHLMNAFVNAARKVSIINTASYIYNNDKIDATFFYVICPYFFGILLSCVDVNSCQKSIAPKEGWS